MRNQIQKMWTASPALTFTCIFMLLALVATLPAIWLDPRVITGQPAWLKPAKFAISISIFTGTMAWLFRYIQIWPRFLRLLGWTFSVILILELAIIDEQALRGTTSHFNISTPLDAALWATMGISIAILLLASIGVVFALFRQPFADRSWGWTLRLAMLISVIGSASGGLMTRPTPAQAAASHHHQNPGAVGAHTVGAPDGGPSLPAVGWSTNHGDLRIPHFFGMHAIQILPLLCWLFARRRTPLVFTFAASYFTLFAILLTQALHGESIAQPGSATLTALAIWLLATGAATAAFTLRMPNPRLTQTI